MIKALILILLTAILPSNVPAQSRKKHPTPKPGGKKTTPAEKPETPPIIGSNVSILTRNGDRIGGTLLELTDFSIRLKSDDLESVISLDTVASMAFGDAAPTKGQSPAAPPSANFTRDVETMLAAFQSLASELRNDTGYTEYGRQITDLKRAADKFVVRYGSSEEATESRCAALAAAALTDYSWARTIWTLKFGYSGNAAVSETDSPAVADALSLYSDVRQSAAGGTKFSADKLINGLWKKASEKVDVLRSLSGRSR